jgi:hypothetical protein
MTHRRAPLVTLIALLVVLLTIPRLAYTGAATGASALDVVISEIAWIGTTASHADEWIELYNNTGGDIDLTGWTLQAADGTPSIALVGTIPAGGHFLLERTDDDSEPLVTADQIYTGALSNEGEDLVLSDGGGHRFLPRRDTVRGRGADWDREPAGQEK